VRPTAWGLRTKFVVFTTLLLLVVVSVVGLLLVRHERRILTEAMIQTGTTMVESLGIAFTDTLMYQELRFLEQGGLLDSYIAQAMAKPGTDLVYLMVLDPEGRVIAHSDTTQFGVKYTDEVGRRALEARGTLIQRHRGPDGREVLDVATPLAISTRRWGTLLAGFSLRRLEANLASAIRQILGATAILFVVSLGAALVLGRRLLEPLRRLAQTMERTSGLDAVPPMDVEREDEIGLLARQYVAMLGRLREANRELHRQQEAVARAEKLASIGRLAAGVAHEINNPLAGMQTCVAALQEGGQDPATVGQYHALVQGGLSRIQRIVAQLLDFARERELSVSTVNVGRVLEETLALVRYQVERKRLKLAVILPQPPVSLHGDGNQLQQVFLNLMLNALDAVSEGGEVRISARRDTDGVEIAVTDNGCGIAEQDVGKIFDPFFSTKGVGQGTGLGLSVSYGIVQAHGGRISVESRVGLGSTFRVWLPAGSGTVQEESARTA
jgi:signal transduction histidine kinase